MYKNKVFLAVFAFIIFAGVTSFSLHARGATRSGEIRISSADNSYGSQSVIVLGPNEESAITVSKYYSGRVTHKKLDIALYRIQQPDLLKFLTYTKTKGEDGYDDYKNAPFNVSGLDFITNFTFEGSAEQKISLPLEGTGMWLVRATLDGADYNDAVLLRSDTGVMVREGNDNTTLFWGQSLRTGKSISQGDVNIYNLENTPKVLSSGVFDATGTVRQPLNKQGDIAVITSGEDISIVVLNLPMGYRYEKFNPRTVSRKYYLFTDRPLYKPGDTVYFKAVIRDDNDALYTVPQGTAHVKVFKDYQREQPLFEKNIPLSAEGTVAGSYVIPEDSKKGYYQIEVDTGLEIERTQWLRGLTYFNVQEYRKPEYSLDVKTPKLEIVSGDEAVFQISGQYFFGQSLKGKLIKYTVSAENYYNSDFYYPDEQDNINGYGYWGGNTIIDQSVVLNDDGVAEVTINTKDLVTAGLGKDFILSFEATFMDESGNPSVANKNILVRGSDYSLYKTSYKYSGRVGEVQSIPLKLISNSSGISPANIKLTVQPSRHWWTRTLNPKAVGKYGSLFTYKEHTEELDTTYITTNTNGDALLNFTPTHAGSHKFKVSYKDSRGNTAEKDFSLWIIPENELLYSDQYKEKLTVDKDKQQYIPGETAQLTITSEVPDRDIFVSVERDGVKRYVIVPLKGKVGQVSIPTMTGDIPNVTIAASSFSGDSFDYTTESLVISADSKKVKVGIDVRGSEKKFAPGESVTVDVTTTDINGKPLSADVALWSVDKALYELMKDQRQSIFSAFWYQRYNSTAYSQSLEGIRSDGAEKGCFVAGTSILTPSGSSPIEKLKIGDSVLTREGEHDSDLISAKIKAIHKVTVPGYLIINHTLKLTPEHILWVNDSWTMAGNIQIGNTLTNSAGEKETVQSIEWQGGAVDVYNLEIERYHTFFAENLWVHNDKGDGSSRTAFKDTAYWNPAVHTDANGRATVTFKLPDNLTTWVMNAVAVTQTTQVGETREEIIVTKPVIVRPALPNLIRVGDTAELVSIVSNYTEKADSFTALFDFSAPGIAPASQTVELAKDGIKNLFWKVSPTGVNPSAVVKMSLKNNEEGDSIELPLPVKEFGFFERFARVGHDTASLSFTLKDDTDTKVSKASLSLAASFLGTLPSAMNYLVSYPYGCIEQTTSKFVPAVLAKEHADIFGTFIKENDLNTIIKGGADRLADLSLETGGWTWWHWGELNPFISAYATEYLVRAQRLGYTVDTDVLELTRRNFERYLVDVKDPAARIAYVYTLSLLGSEKGKTQLTNFDGVTSDIVALAVLSNIRNGYTDANKNGVNELIRRAIRTENTAHWEPGNTNFFPSTEASTALALRALTTAGKKDVAEQAARYLYQNRPREYWRNSFATAQVIEALTLFSKVYTDTKPNSQYQVVLNGKEISSGKMTSLTEEVVLPISLSSKENVLQIVKNGEGDIYSTLIVDEFRTSKKPKAVDDTLKVERTYSGDFTVGDTIIVNLKVSNIPDGSRYLVVEDVLPAGLIPINPIFDNETDSGRYRNYYSGYSYPSAQEITKEGMITSFEYINSDVIEFTYKARVVTRGIFNTPPATAALMYDPDIYGRTSSSIITIDDSVKTKATKDMHTPINRPSVKIFLILVLGIWAVIAIHRLIKK
jgi:uncharacterized protein YfaS (alpha-2-macroglobulin family)